MNRLGKKTQIGGRVRAAAAARTPPDVFFAHAGVVSRPGMLHFATTAPRYGLTQIVHNLTQAAPS